MTGALHIAGTSFEPVYISVREKEGRTYTDAELLRLPDIEKDHPHYIEWQLREESYGRLKKYLAKKISPMKILEVGCGNGWLSQRLSSLHAAAITGIDINKG
jgi:2-polyprenyl-3-methyl-5-hydroxy-6-metoxy-1,4-benzoquinol methylase